MWSLPTFSATSIHFITLELSNAFKHDWYDCHFYVNAAILLTSYASSIVNLCETSSRGVPVQLCPDVVCGNRLYRAVLHIHSYVQTEIYLFFPTEFFAVAHAAQSIHYRMKWLIPTACFCGALEVAGWSGRLWSHFSPYLDSPFQLQ